MSAPHRAPELARRALEELLDRRIRELVEQQLRERDDQHLEELADDPESLIVRTVDRAVRTRREALARTDSPYRAPWKKQ